MLLQGQASDSSPSPTSPRKSGSGAKGVGESWASEFHRSDFESEPSLLGSTMAPGTETDDGVCFQRVFRQRS